jgi:anti-sigma B factor antagonist
MVRFETAGTQLRVTFSGRLDTQSCKEMTAQIDKELGAGATAVAFDLAQVNYVCSAFLRICISAAKLKGAGFSVVNVTPQVMAVFKMAGLDKAFKVSGV